MTSRFIYAPWTDEQVMQLNRFQRSPFVHPFTCPSERHDAVLMASRNNWECPYPDCDYTQNWAHDFMADHELLDFLNNHHAKRRDAE